MKRSDRRSDCPINFALQTFGDPWSLLIIRDLMFKGKRTYTEFLNGEEGIATNILASRLRRLQKAGLIERRGEGRRATYALTEKGIDLAPAMADLIVWSAKHDEKTAADPEFVERMETDRAGALEELRADLTNSYRS